LATCQDLSLLRVADGLRVPPSEDAGLPGSPSVENFDAVFVGVNKNIAVDAAEVMRYQEAVTEAQIKAAYKDLKPARLSVASGRAVFTTIAIDPATGKEIITHNQGKMADCISYEIATTPGSSGSAISEAGSKLIYGKLFLDDAVTLYTHIYCQESIRRHIGRRGQSMGWNAP